MVSTTELEAPCDTTLDMVRRRRRRARACVCGESNPAARSAATNLRAISSRKEDEKQNEKYLIDYK